MFFHSTLNKAYFPTKFDNYLAVHEEPEHITHVRTYRSACFVHANVFSFRLSIDWCVEF